MKKKRGSNRIFEYMKHLLSLKVFLVFPLLASVYAWSFWEPEVQIPLPPSAKKKIVEKVDHKWVDEMMAKLTLREKIGQFFMVAAYSNGGEKHLAEIDSMILQSKIGGLIFFQGQRSNLKTAIDRFQEKSDVPLLIGMDAEWGVSMRLFGEERFPYNYTIGAANDPELTEKLAAMIGQECRDLGIHINFAPVVDVNSNPNNPVIGFRSYGGNPKSVAEHVVAAVKGMENQGVLTSIKHFPGHGDTEVDSHLELPIVHNSIKQIDAIDFFPFRSGIRAGASTVMIGHLNVPALDPSGTPSSLSKVTIQKYLKQDLGFRGLVISDALGMKAVADRYGKTEVVVKAFEAGCDILLFPESVKDAIDAIEKKVVEGGISVDKLNARCKRVLRAKYKGIIRPGKVKKYTFGETQLARKLLYEKAITVIKNESEVLPIKRFDQKIAVVSVGAHVDPLKESMDLVASVEHFHFYTAAEAIVAFRDKIQDYDIIITTLHAKSVRPRNDFGMPKKWREWLGMMPAEKKSILALFGNPLVLRKGIYLENIDGIVIGYENHKLMLNRMGQFLMGTFESSGKLPITLNQEFKDGRGLKVKWAGRLKDSQPEELGIDPLKLAEIDTIVEHSIKEKAFPGCQIVVAVEGKIIYRKSFGYHTYDKKRTVVNDDIYDIASVTKIAASTLSVMRLNSQDKFDLDKCLQDYLPNLMGGSKLGHIKMKDMMSHQAGLTPWIPFYLKTLADEGFSSEFYSQRKTSVYNTQVANDLWIKGDYTNVMYNEILKSKLGARKYKYSDLGYYFLKKIIEKQTSQSLDEYVLNEFYSPMGLKTMRYNPLYYFSKDKIPPTENDLAFRKQLIHGYVHDQGAAMMGGVGGHAGVFSNASDLAAIMQLFLNNGSYGGVSYITPEVINEYTGCQYCPSSRRGAGFDKPTIERNGGPTSKLASLSSYGHSGFTGTLAWADPEYKVNYIFLSNRVYPDAENRKIVKMNIRTEIQRVIYEALKEAK